MVTRILACIGKRCSDFIYCYVTFHEIASFTLQTCISFYAYNELKWLLRFVIP